VQPDIELMIDRALNIGAPPVPLASIRMRAWRRSASEKSLRLFLWFAAVFAITLPMMYSTHVSKGEAEMFHGAVVTGLGPQVQPAPTPSS
jgi:hypothetical protein